LFLFFSENEEHSVDISAKDDEIFFGPVGHTEKCVAVGVNQVAQASHRLQPLSPLSATQMAELCREAYTVAYQIEHGDGTKPPYSHAKTSGVSHVMSRSVNAVKDLMSNVAVAHQNKQADSAEPLTSHAEATEATSGEEIPSDNSVKDLILNVDVACESEHAGMANPLTAHVETAEATSSDQLPSDNPAEDLISDVAVAYQNEHCDSSVPPAKSPETDGVSDDVKLSSNNQVEDLALNAGEADSGLCLEEALSNNSFNGLTSGSTESRRESFDNKPSSTNAFEGLLSSLGSALPIIEPGTLKQDEQGVVKFTAAAPAADADTKTKCRSGIPAPCGLRRAFSAKSAGIPVKVLTVGHSFDY